MRLAGLDEHFVDEAPAVAVFGFVAAHDGMVGLFKMFGGVFVLGIVAAAYVPADHAETQGIPLVEASG